jgi:hypothetical protein
MLDHAGSAVSDYESSKSFYEKALAPLGITLVAEPSGQAAGFGTDELAFFWIEAQGQPARGRLHVAFVLTTEKASISSTPRRSKQAQPTTARPGSARSITRTTTARTSSTPTATTSRQSVIARSSTPVERAGQRCLVARERSGEAAGR